LGEMEVREANLKKSEHLCRIGDKVLFIYWIAYIISWYSLCFECAWTVKFTWLLYEHFVVCNFLF
jgi:hypothetical protein